jgi:hypothetical protein
LNPDRAKQDGSTTSTSSHGVYKELVVKGVEFLVDDEGRKKAVLIDLKKCGEVWEDFYDTLRVKERESEPRESLEEVKKKVLGRS